MFLDKKIVPTITNTALYLLPLCIGVLIKDPLTNLYTKTVSPAGVLHTDASAKLEHGARLYQQGNTTNAITTFNELLNIAPETSRTLLYLAKSYAAQNKHAQAIHWYHCALTLEPRFIHGYTALGTSYLELKQYDQAIRYLSIAQDCMPQNSDVQLQLSRAYMNSHDYNRALHHAQKAYELDSTNIHTLLNLGHIHNKQGTLEQAAEWYQKAIALDPHCANAHYNLGYTLRIMKKPNEALKHLLEAERLHPNYVDAHIALAQLYWAMQKYDRAWKKYEWRWKLLGVDPYTMHAPLWDGCDLHGKTILLYCEQGLGDTIQFIRYAKMVKEKGGYVIAKVQKPLLPLLYSYPYVDRYITSVEELKNTHLDYQSPLLNLPGTFTTNDATIPADIPYLTAQPELVNSWKQQLAHDKKFKIGLCWHVDPEHELDKSPWSKRTMSASLFAPLARIPHVSFYSLQKVNGEEQLKDLPEDFVVHTFDYRFDESHGRFMDTAAVIANLDLIITVDTSIAHIAGAMGKQVWMLLPYSPDPRWYDEGERTRWYSTMKLFRQPKPYDWNSVIKQIEACLKQSVTQPVRSGTSWVTDILTS